MIICGIDPGLSQGGLAFFRGTLESVKVHKMPREITEFAELIEYYLRLDKDILIFLEKVQLRQDDIMIRPGEDGGGKAFRIEKMLTHFHEVRGCLKIKKIPFVEMYPISWQTELRLKSGYSGETGTDRKNRYKSISQTIFKTIKVTLWSSDALLIMEAGRRKMIHDPKWVQDRIWNPAKTTLF